jgi:predicted nucleic acid-binding protein
MASNDEAIVYWDSSAVISALLEDSHSEKVINSIRVPGGHLISSLGLAEVFAVICRVQRLSGTAPDLVKNCRKKINNGPWERINLLPNWDLFESLSEKWSLRGADLWHLAMVKTLAENFPEVQLLTFDQKLSEAAEGEGFAANLF